MLTFLSWTAKELANILSKDMLDSIGDRIHHCCPEPFPCGATEHAYTSCFIVQPLTDTDQIDINVVFPQKLP